MELYVHGDAARLPLADDSVQLIVTSPPYAKMRASEYGGIDADDYVQWFLKIADELARVLKPRGSFVLNIKEGSENGARQTYVYRLLLALVDSGWHWHDEYLWYKKSVFPGAFKTRFVDCFERIYHLSRSAEIVFNRDEVRIRSWGPSVNKMRKAKSNISKNKDKYQHKASFYKESKYPLNILVANNNGGETFHPAVFPASIPRFFIALCSDEGDMVLDPFSGSGTTVRVANEMLRNGIGTEVKYEYASEALRHGSRYERALI